MPEKEEKPTGEEFQFVNFRLREEEFGVEVSSVREIIRVTDISRIPEAPSFIQGVTNLRGQIIPVIDLSKRFNLVPLETLPESARIIVTGVNEQIAGILVDEVPEVLKIVEENIEPTPELIQIEIKKDYIKGVAKLENRLIILLDLEKVLAPHEVVELADLSSPESET
ncbi:MAG: chemotaxis protein CheW [Candidatus Neomarinimicrobiota bacterium]